MHTNIMPWEINRRRFLETAALGGASSLVLIAPGQAQGVYATNTAGPASAPGASSPLKRLEPLKFVDAGVLNIAYYEAGPADGPVALLMHGFPYDIHSYVDVAPLLAARGMRVIVPYLRGYAPTRYLDASTLRSGEQAALGSDLIALMDALKVKSAVVAGYDWGGRAACVVAALYPERCIGLVCVNSYLIQDIARSQEPMAPKDEAPLWYQYYFHQPRGQAGLAKHRRDLTRILWTQWSPGWKFDDATFERAAIAFDIPDFVDTVIHSYRHRFGLVAGDIRYAAIQERLKNQPPISVPAITLDGGADGVVPPTDGKSTASRFSGKRTHRIIPDVGHNLPQEAPKAFADAVAELAGIRHLTHPATRCHAAGHPTKDQRNKRMSVEVNQISQINQNNNRLFRSCRISLIGLIVAGLAGAGAFRAQSSPLTTAAPGAPTNGISRRIPQNAKPTIVLVHGAFADGTGWQHVIPILEKDGYSVIAVQNALSSFAGDIETTKRVIDAQKGSVVVVGHSYGGAVITGAAAGNAHVKALVYIAAFAPDADEPIGAFNAKYPSALASALRPDAAGFVYIDRKRFRDLFARDVSVTEASVMAVAQKPIIGSVFAGSVKQAAWRTIPSWYLVAQQDRAINPDLERFYAKRMGAKTTEIKSSHVPFVSHPHVVARLIEQAASASLKTRR